MHETRHKNKPGWLTGLLCLFMTYPCFSEETIRESVYIRADEMHFDLRSSSSIYKGNVTIRRGDIELRGEHVEIQQTDKIISKIVASGNPARFTQTGKNGNSMKAESRHIQYFADEERLVMTEGARLVQNEQIIESNHISYDTAKQALIAGKQSDESGSPQRVKMTLTPDTE